MGLSLLHSDGSLVHCHLPREIPQQIYRRGLQRSEAMSNHRQLDDGGSSHGDVYDYYSEPPDAVKPEGRTILLLTIFAILVAISIGYFVLNLLFPGLRDQIEGTGGSADEDNDDIGNQNIAYKPPRPSAGEIALV